jgi:hypothetical protein
MVNFEGDESLQGELFGLTRGDYGSLRAFGVDALFEKLQFIQCTFHFDH